MVRSEGIRLLIFSFTNKKLGSCYSVLTRKKWSRLKSQTILRFKDDTRIQGNPLPPRLEKQVNTGSLDLVG